MESLNFVVILIGILSGVGSAVITAWMMTAKLSQKLDESNKANQELAKALDGLTASSQRILEYLAQTEGHQDLVSQKIDAARGELGNKIALAAGEIKHEINRK